MRSYSGLPFSQDSVFRVLIGSFEFDRRFRVENSGLVCLDFLGWNRAIGLADYDHLGSRVEWAVRKMPF